MADGYTVTDVVQRQRFSPAGARVSFYDLYVTTDRGTSGTLRIDQKDYNKETVKAMLDDFAKSLDMPFDL